jgi:L-ascorbate metabolism protein UlaG (beta-lactamase superfamily)
MIEPVLSDDALAADIDHADPGSGLLIWWLGQSGFLVKSASGRILFDPYLSDSLTVKYAHTDKPHVRMTARAIAPDRLSSIDVITSSHNHTDHLDAETLTGVLAANPSASLVIPEANRAFVTGRLGCDPALPLGLTDGKSITIGNIVVHAVPAAHNEIERDAKGRSRYLGYIVNIGGMNVYHSGDTLRYPQMAELVEPFSIDVAFLPINGNRPQRRVAGNMFGDEAAQLATDVGVRLAIPCHYDMFEFNTEPPDLFVTTCRRLGQPHKVLQCGERFSIGPRTAS